MNNRVKFTLNSRLSKHTYIAKQKTEKSTKSFFFNKIKLRTQLTFWFEEIIHVLCGDIYDAICGDIYDEINFLWPSTFSQSSLESVRGGGLKAGGGGDV